MQTMDMTALFAWFVARAGDIRSLHIDLFTEAAWPPILAVLGVVGRSLQHLRLAGETPACQRVGCYAPWLQLTPRLTSLELDDVVDGAISHAIFPPGALFPPGGVVSFCVGRRLLAALVTRTCTWSR